jgi:hypothetical protein
LLVPNNYIDDDIENTNEGKEEILGMIMDKNISEFD